MKTAALTLTIILSLFFAGSARASDTEGTAAGTPVGQAVNVGNKICPVSGDKVGEMGDVVTFEHEGKIYNFCCKMCLKDFAKDPQKYINKVNEELKNEQK